MKTLLLNGCSFGDCWTPTSEFIKSLNCDTVTNISKVGRLDKIPNGFPYGKNFHIVSIRD